MADGPFRFQQGSGQFHYSQPGHHSLAPRRFNNRTGSPAKAARGGFDVHPPSPTRSPRSRSPTHGMYNQSQQQHPNLFMNGSHGSRAYNLQMGASKPYQSTNHLSQSQQRQQHEVGNHGQGGNFGGHQHNASTSGFGNVTPQFSHAQTVRTGTPSHAENGMDENASHEWALQMQLYNQSKESMSKHSHARLNPSSRHGNSADMTKGLIEKDERFRTTEQFDSFGQGWDELDLSGQGLKALSLGLFNYDWLKKLYLNNNALQYVDPAIGRLRQLTYLDLSHNGLPYLPPEIGMLTQLKVLLLFDNRLTSIPEELGSLYALDLLGLHGNPMPDFRQELIELGTKRFIRELQARMHEPDPPPQRDWIAVDESNYASISTADRIKVLSYNTLAESMASSEHYGYTRPELIAWNRRKDMILDECKELAPDIMCLQEISTDSYNEFFRRALAVEGYKGVYFAKSRSKTMMESESKRVDGCATFVKDDKYIVLDKHCIEFASYAINRADMKGHEDVFNRVMPKDHIATAVFLESRQTGARMIIVNTHFCWEAHFRDVKVVQAAIMMEQVARLADNWAKLPPCTESEKQRFRFADGAASEENSPDAPPLEPAQSQEYPDGRSIPLIICSDVNSLPDSGVYQLIATGQLPGDHPDLGEYQYGSFTRDGMSHPFSLRSAYAPKDLPFTNYTPTFQGMIDYIWYSTGSLQVTGLLGEVDRRYLQRVPGFPNWHFPSDHLSLMAELALKPRAEKKGFKADFGSQK